MENTKNPNLEYVEIQVDVILKVRIPLITEQGIKFKALFEIILVRDSPDSTEFDKIEAECIDYENIEWIGKTFNFNHLKKIDSSGGPETLGLVSGMKKVIDLWEELHLDVNKFDWAFDFVNQVKEYSYGKN